MKIYLANQDGTTLYKIGVTKKDPKVRLLELQTGNPFPLVLIESFQTNFNYKLESALHAYYSTNNVQSEWFELSYEQVDAFIIQCNKLEEAFKVLKSFDNPFI